MTLPSLVKSGPRTRKNHAFGRNTPPLKLHVVNVLNRQ